MWFVMVRKVNNPKKKQSSKKHKLNHKHVQKDFQRKHKEDAEIEVDYYRD